ncbi:LysR family transcriptional regulator [Eoetvoesiella caeni]
MAKLNWYIRSNLKLSHLQLLVALDDFRSIGRVAGYLNVSQPAISKALASLETNLGFPLFNRTTRGMDPTEYGECLVRHARDILRRLVNIEEELLDLSEGRIARISMGVLPAAATVLVPHFVADMDKNNADITLSVREGTMEALLPMLRAGDIDFVVGNRPMRPLGPEFETELLYEDPIVVVVRPGHPLTKVENVQWPMLAGYSMVLPTQDASTRAPIDDFLAGQAIDIPRQHLESLSTLTNIGVLQFTDSIAFSSRVLAGHFQKMGLLSVLPLTLPETSIHVGLVWMADRKKTKVHEILLEQLRNTRDSVLRAS